MLLICLNPKSECCPGLIFQSVLQSAFTPWVHQGVLQGFNEPGTSEVLLTIYELYFNPYHNPLLMKTQDKPFIKWNAVYVGRTCGAYISSDFQRTLAKFSNLLPWCNGGAVPVELLWIYSALIGNRIYSLWFLTGEKTF